MFGRVLLSDSQLREHALALAARYPPCATSSSDLLQHLATDAATVEKAFRAACAAAAAGSRTLEPAAEWLIDNFYVIEEQVKEFRAGLPKPYLRELPLVEVARGNCVPRILMLMRELVDKADGRVVVRLVHDFVASYQQIARLTLGELWAIPLMLRLALIEQLSPLTSAMTHWIHACRTTGRATGSSMPGVPRSTRSKSSSRPTMPRPARNG